jgi:hypothetical protein
MVNMKINTDYVPIKTYIAQGATTFDSRYSEEELIRYGIEITTEKKAEVICGESIERLAPYISRYGSKREYLVWCDEPLWSTIWTKLTNRVVHWSVVSNAITFKKESNTILVNVMNCFTGDVFLSNKMFLIPEYVFNQEIIEEKKNNYNAPRAAAAFLTCRQEEIFDYNHPAGVMGISRLRTSLAFEMFKRKVCDIYGPNWPAGVAVYNDRLVDNCYYTNFSQKVLDLRNYKFCLALENTIAPHYVTEKIWQSLLGGCLPIYYAGRQHTIYEDFPENSFIDFAQIGNVDNLCGILSSMSEVEYTERLNICQEVMIDLARQSNLGKFAQNIQLQTLQNKLEFIVGKVN